MLMHRLLCMLSLSALVASSLRPKALNTETLSETDKHFLISSGVAGEIRVRWVPAGWRCHSWLVPPEVIHPPTTPSPARTGPPPGNGGVYLPAVPPHHPDRQVLPGGWVGGPEQYVHPRVAPAPVPPHDHHPGDGSQVLASSSVAMQQTSQLLLPFSRIFRHSTIICPFSETWQLRLSLPACSPRLLQPLPPPHHPLAHNSPNHELGQVLVAFDLFGLLAGSFSLGVGLL